MATSTIKISTNVIKGTWVPHLYDYNTKVMELGNQPYWKIGSLYILYIDYVLTNAINDIATMLQIRNFPCNMVLGGNIYIAGINNQAGNRTIQGNNNGVYIRPNITGTITPGTITSCLIGCDWS